MEIQMSAAASVLGMASRVGTVEDGIAMYSTETGNLTATFGQPAPLDYVPRPDFGALDADARGSIDMSEARADGLLDVDFDHADSNGNGGIPSGNSPAGREIVD